MELKGPSEAEVKKFIKFETAVDFYTMSSLHFRGKLLWADDTAYHISLENEKTLTLMKTAIVYYSAV